jgi:hypothetical protein
VQLPSLDRGVEKSVGVGALQSVDFGVRIISWLILSAPRAGLLSSGSANNPAARDQKPDTSCARSRAPGRICCGLAEAIEITYVACLIGKEDSLLAFIMTSSAHNKHLIQ